MKHLACMIGSHKWTSFPDKGVRCPLRLSMGDPVVGFFVYCIMFCDRCGKVSDLSVQRLFRAVYDD